MQLIIPMSGNGSRFINHGYEIPKPLIRVSGHPMVKHVVDMYPGVEEVLFIINQEHFKNKHLNIEKQLGLISPICKIAIIESHKLGPAHAIMRASSFINTKVPVVINYCDFTCIWNFDSFKKQLGSGIDGLIATYTGFHPHMLRSNKFAYVKVDREGYVQNIQEKSPYTDNPMSEEVSSGTYGFKSGQVLLDAVSQQFMHNDSYNGEFYSSLTYKNMISRGKKIKTFNIEKFIQWGTPEDLYDFNQQKKFFYFKTFLPKSQNTVNRVEILAAGSGERFTKSGYTENKAFLKLNKSFVIMEAITALGFRSIHKRILVQETNQIDVEATTLLEQENINIGKVKNLTRGQAESALLALESNLQGPCVIGTCDSLVYPSVGEDISKFSGNVIGVWIAEPNFYAKTYPDQFGWVNIDSNMNIIKSWVKQEPPKSIKTYLITGTFIFGENINSVQLLKDFLRSDLKVKNEFYLDSLIEFALKEKWKVLALSTEWFINLGEPDEYETYKYWETLFDRRPDLLDSYEN